MTERYPLSQWVPASSTNYRSTNRSSVSKVILHITDGHPNALPVAQMWQSPGHGSSAHFVIGQDGTVLQCVSIKDIAWHAHANNGISIGIEHCARSPGELNPSDPGLPLTDDQYKASSSLTYWICKTFGIEMNRGNIQGHSEADSITSHRDCPNGVAGGWDWVRYMSLVCGS